MFKLHNDPRFQSKGLNYSTSQPKAFQIEISSSSDSQGLSQSIFGTQRDATAGDLSPLVVKSAIKIDLTDCICSATKATL
jgi:hypothetical protein